MDTAPLNIDSLERIIPDELETHGSTGLPTLRLHLERYSFAARMIGGGRILDMACGVGYGTRLLVNQNPRIREAHGVDFSESAIAYAREHYGHKQIHYFCQDAMAFTAKEPYDAVVSLETIEHLPDPARFFERLTRLLSPGGVLVASVPTTPSMDGNPNHLTDFSDRSFRKLGTLAGLHELDCLPQVQPFSASAVILGTEKRLARTTPQLVKFYIRHPQKLLLRLWSTSRYGFQNRYLTIAWQKDSKCQ